MLVIFDCDGVLVDSEPIAAQAFSQALAQVGIDKSAKQCFSDFHGLTLADCFAQITADGHQLPDDFESILRHVEAPLFAHGLRPVVGVTAVLKLLEANNIPFCVASNGGREKILRSLQHTGLLPFFGERIFSAEQVNRGKPAPDLFLHCAAWFGFPANACTVIEDSLAGIRAAKSAGMRVLGYARHPGQHEGVQWFSAMEQVPGLLLTD